MFNYLNKNITKIILSTIIFLITLFIINNQFLGKFIWWFPELFGDLKTPIKWLECNDLGFNFYEDKDAFIKCAKREFNYGKIFFQIPYSNKLNFFYINILPYLLIFFSIYLVFKIFNIQSYISLIVLILAILNPSSFLLFSSGNIDLLIFVILIFTILNRIYFVNWFLYFFLTFVKIYPLILFLNIFIENKKRSIKKIIIIFSLVIMLSLSYFYFNYSEYIYLLNNLSGAKAGYHYLFSLNSFAKIFRYLLDLNYIFLLLITYMLFFYLSLMAYKKISYSLNKSNHQIIEIYSIESRLFIISSSLSIICYIFFSNFFHREIFLIGTLPLIFKLDMVFKKFPFKIIINLFLIKLIYSYIYSYFNVHDGIQYADGQRIFSSLFIIIFFIKSLIDYLLMVMITALSLYYVNLFLNNFKNKNLTLNEFK